MPSLDAAVVPAPTPPVRDTRTALERARHEFDSGHMKTAIDLLEVALAFEKSHVGARTMLALAYARTRRLERAFEELERALALDPHGFGPRCALGELYLRLGIPDQGREHLDHALAHAAKPEEQAYVRELLRQERAMARHRVPRPSFRQPFRRWRRPGVKSE